MDIPILSKGSSDFQHFEQLIFNDQGVYHFEPHALIILLGNSLYNEEKRSNEQGFNVPKSYMPHMNRWLSESVLLKINHLTHHICSSFCTEILTCHNALLLDGFHSDCMNPVNILKNIYEEISKNNTTLIKSKQKI